MNILASQCFFLNKKATDVTSIRKPIGAIHTHTHIFLLKRNYFAFWFRKIVYGGREIVYGGREIVYGGPDIYIEAAIYISRSPIIYGGRHLLYRGRQLENKSRPPFIIRGRHIYISRSPYIYRGRHIYIAVAIYISRSPYIYCGRHIYIAVAIYISRSPYIYSRSPYTILRNQNAK